MKKTCLTCSFILWPEKEFPRIRLPKFFWRSSGELIGREFLLRPFISCVCVEGPKKVLRKFFGSLRMILCYWKTLSVPEYSGCRLNCLGHFLLFVEQDQLGETHLTYSDFWRPHSLGLGGPDALHMHYIQAPLHRSCLQFSTCMVLRGPWRLRKYYMRIPLCTDGANMIVELICFATEVCICSGHQVKIGVESWRVTRDFVHEFQEIFIYNRNQFRFREASSFTTGRL